MPLRGVRQHRPHDQVEESAAGLLVGVAVRNSDLAAHPLVRERYPMLARAVLAGASGQIRNMATVGNLLQRTRCTYFQDPSMSCNKRTAWLGCPAVEGDHENLAILGHFAGSATECVATHPSGRLAAVVHHVVEQTAIRTEFAEQTAACSRVMYASSAVRTTAPAGAARRAGEVRVPRLLGVFAASGSSTRCWRGPSSSAA